MASPPPPPAPRRGASPARIVVLGASGYTGTLLAEALVAAGLRPVLAGRSPERIAAVADRLGGLETAVADTGNPASVAALVGPGDVLATTVGPFARHGAAALDAAIAAGAHYLDSTGEPGFVREVFSAAGPRAAVAGSALLTAFGYDFVPGNLAAALALRAAGPTASRVVTGYFLDGDSTMSSGTRATAAGGLLDPSHRFVDGRLVLLPTGRLLRRFTDRGRQRPAVLYGSTESLALPRSFPQLTEVTNYLGWFGASSYAMVPASYTTGLLRLPPLRARLARAADRAAAVTGRGPDAARRATQRTVVLAVAADARGRELASVRLEGPGGYELTGRLMAWGAAELAAGGVAARGACGPVDAFGLDRLVEGCREAGLTVTP